MMTEHNPMTTPAARNQTAKRELVEQHGDKTQVERYYAGLLPEEELLALARRVLFQPLSAFKRYQKITASDVKHGDECAWGATRVQFFTRDVADGITGDEWTTYRRINDVITEMIGALPMYVYIDLDIVEHVGLCGFCEHRETTRRALSVRITWAGHELVREYALGAS